MPRDKTHSTFVIFGSVRIRLRKIRDSKVYTKIRSRTKGWPGADRFSRLFSHAARSGKIHTTSHEKPTTHAKNFAMVSATEMSRSSSADASRSSPLSWNHGLPDDNGLDTDEKKSQNNPAGRDSKFEIHVTRGVHVDVESVKSRKSDPETGGNTKRGRTDDNDAPVRPFLPASPPPGRGRISELSLEGRQGKPSMTLSPKKSSQRMSNGPNDMKWISNDHHWFSYVFV